MPSPRERQLVFYPWTDLDVLTKWTVKGVDTAITQHERGQFQLSGKLIEAFGRDIRLGTSKSGVIGTRANALLGAPFRLKPSDPDDPRAVKIAKEMEPHWWTVCPEAATRELLRYYWLGGGAPGQLVWGKIDVRSRIGKRKRWLPVVEPWQLQHFYYTEESDGSSLGRKLKANTMKGLVDVNPGDGVWLMLHDGARWWLNGSVRCIGIPWIGVALTTRDWWRHSERMGHPIIKAKYPAVADSNETAAWVSDLVNLKSQAVLKLPQGVGSMPDSNYDVELLEAKQYSPETFQELLKISYVNYAVHILGHNLSAEVGEGQAVTSDSGEVRTDYKKADAETLSTQLRRDVTIPWAAEWYPDGAELAPWPVWDVEPKKDAKLRAETQKLAAEALTIFVKAGYRPKDMNAWAEPYDLELVSLSEADAGNGAGSDGEEPDDSDQETPEDEGPIDDPEYGTPGDREPAYIPAE